MKFKSYYWAIFAAIAVVVLFLLVLPRVFSGSGGSSPTTQNQPTYNYTPMIEAYQDLIKANPKDVIALGGLGDVYMQMGRYSDAKDVYVKAEAVSPGEAVYRGRLGEAYFELGQTDRALAEFNNGLAIDPNNQAILVDLGIISSSTNKPAQAKQYWQKAVAVNSNNDLGHTAKELIAQMETPGSTTGLQNPHQNPHP